MKKLIFLLIIILGFGCSRTKKITTESKGIVKGYAKTVLSAPSKAKVVSDLTAIKEALQEYKIEHGKFPPSLDELKLRLYYPNGYNYNPETGEVKSKHYPEL